MPLNPLVYACSYDLYVFLHENSHFLFKIISIFIQKRINRKCFQKISSRELPHSKRISEMFIFYIKNDSF